MGIASSAAANQASGVRHFRKSITGAISDDARSDEILATTMIIRALENRAPLSVENLPKRQRLASSRDYLHDPDRVSAVPGNLTADLDLVARL